VEGSLINGQDRITNRDIPHVGSGTPGGEWLRRYWLVVGTVPELHDVPRAVRVLGEDLVLFRDLAGRVGLVGRRCAHRGSSLEYGDIEKGGIRCPYHGWLFDVSGNCFEQPSEPAGRDFCGKVKQLAYPVREKGGLIFAYMGPDSANPPPLPNYSPLVDRGGQRLIESTRYFDYNWFNFYENSADPCHVWILHSRSAYGEQTWGNQFFSIKDPPDYTPVETPYGMKMVMSKPGPTPETEFVDEMSLSLPSILQVGDTEFVHAKVDPEVLTKVGSNYEHFMFLTPNDDHHFMLFTVDYYTGPDPDIFRRLAEMRTREVPRQEVKPYDSRPLMPFRGNIRQEDIVTQGTQDLLGLREEHLGPSDRGVIMLRKMVRDAIQAVAEGREPKALHLEGDSAGLVRLDSFVGVRPRHILP
jgi:phenylpropionate dioxygenase-like ring-hydroxylating dioxygenase large terminal subunit